MNDAPSSLSAPAATGGRGRADQDVALANRINEYHLALMAAQEHAELAARLGPRGYGAATLAQGAALCDAAQAGFNARNAALAEQQAALSTLQAAEGAARGGFGDFRAIARALFQRDADALIGLRVKGRVPADREQFLTTAHAAYDAGLGNAEWGARLAPHGYDQAALQAEQAKLAALAQAAVKHETARAAAQRATTERDAAGQALDSWWNKFRAVARVALRERPDLLRALGM
jgi:hypothetical protein